MIYKLNNKIPKIGKNNFIAETASIIGEIILNDDVSIWFGSVLRGDIISISVDTNTNIQEGCSLHGEVGMDIVIGKNVTIGHNCIIHGGKIGDNCLIGMGSIITDGVIIPNNCFISANSMITSKIGKIPEGSFIKGNPAKIIGEISSEQMNIIKISHEAYSSKKDVFFKNLEEIKL